MAGYIKWHITQKRATDSYKAIESSDFNLYDKTGNKISWYEGTTAESSLVSWQGEGADKLIDGNVNTKWGSPNWGSSAYGDAIITFTIPDENSLDEIGSYSYTTGHDNSAKDPVSWELLFSKDGTEYTIVDSQSNVDIPTGRKTETEKFTISWKPASEKVWTMPVLDANEKTIDGITYIASADSSINSSMLPYMAFNGNNADTLATQGQSWHSAKATTQGTHWLMVSMSNPVKVSNISIHHRYTAHTNENHNVKDFVFEGSNDGSAWVSLIEGTCEGVPASSDTFSVENPGYYTMYRLRAVTTYSIYSSEVYAVIGELVLNGYIEGELYKKYLIKSENVIYTVSNGALQALTETEITSSLFQTYGVDDVPDGSLLLNLSNPSVMYWTNAEELPVITANVAATPQSQNVISNAIDLTHQSITGIESATVNCNGELIIAVSFDNKQTWKAWNGSEWSTLSEDFTGMNKETFESITFEQWNLLFTGASSFYIRVSLIDTTQSVTEIIVDFAN